MIVSTLPLSQIDEGIRFRKEYHDVDSLIEQIERAGGLIHPIAVIEKSKAPALAGMNGLDKSKPYLLIAGGRRFRAFTQRSDWQTIAAHVYAKPLEADELRELELIENISREDLTWQEEAALTKEIHDLRVARAQAEAEAGKSKPRAQGSTVTTGHSQSDTAKLLGKSGATVTRELKLATALERNPELGKAKTRKEALKMIDREEEKRIIAELARREQKKKVRSGKEAVVKKLQDSYVSGDFFVRVKQVPDKSVDLVIFDPPYAIYEEEVVKRSDVQTFDDWTGPVFKTNITQMLAEAKRVMRDNAWGLMWYALEPWHAYVLDQIRRAGFQCNGLPVIWNKGGGETRAPHFNLGSQYEPCLYFKKGQPIIRELGRTNLITHPTPKNKIHPTEKPLTVIEYLMTTFASPGATIMSGFLGSGNDLLAAHNVDMRAFGFDLSDNYRNEFIVRSANMGADNKFTQP